LSFGGYGLALAALALMVFGAIECLPCSPAQRAPLAAKDGTLGLETAKF